MSIDKNGVYALVGLNTSGECMTKVDGNHYYPTVDSVTLVDIRNLDFIDVSLEEFRKVSYHNLCIRAYHMDITSSLQAKEDVVIDYLNDMVYAYSNGRKKMGSSGKISGLTDCGIFLVDGQYIDGLKSDSLLFFGGGSILSFGNILRCFNAYERVFYNYIVFKLKYGSHDDWLYECVNTVNGKSITIDNYSNYHCNNGEIKVESLWEDDGIFKKIDNLYIIDYGGGKRLKDVIIPPDCKALYFYTGDDSFYSLYIDKLVIPPQCESIGANGHYRYINFGEVYISSGIKDYDFNSLVWDIKEAVDSIISFKKIKICRY
jgi:hypothetical protein